MGSGYVVTPQWVGTFEKNIQTLFVNSWERVSQNLNWEKFMEPRPSTTLTELYTWLLQTGGIHDLDAGGQLKFDSISALYREITNSVSGTALELTQDEISDNMLDPRNHPGLQSAGPALDYAGAWAREIGGASAYRPQQMYFRMLADGETGALATAYDGQPMFGTHKVNPYDDGAGTYKNILTGAADGAYPGACPIDTSVSLATAVENLARAVAYPRTLVAPNGIKRMLRIVRVSCGPLLEKRITDVLQARFFGSDGSQDNTLANRKIGIEICDEIDSATNYYLDCEPIAGEGAAAIWQVREPYIMSSYTPLTQWELSRLEKFAWKYRGRNAIAWGHPWLKYLVKAT